MWSNRHWVLFLGGLIFSGCTSIDGGDCDQTTPDRQWYFITQSGATGTLKKCVMCNFSLSVDEYEPWILESAGDDYLSSDPTFADVLPCVYVYGPGPYETESQCRSLACVGVPETNDAVSANHHAGQTILEEREASD